LSLWEKRSQGEGRHKITVHPSLSLSLRRTGTSENKGETKARRQLVGT